MSDKRTEFKKQGDKIGMETSVAGHAIYRRLQFEEMKGIMKLQ